MSTDLRFVTWMPDTDTQSMKVVADMRGDIAQTVMAAMAAIGFELDTTRWNIQLVVRDQQLIVVDAIKVDHRNH